MKFKLLVVMTDDDLSGRVIETARANGATGCTVVTSARGEWLERRQPCPVLPLPGRLGD